MRISAIRLAAIASISLPLMAFADPKPTTNPAIDLSPNNVPSVSASDAVATVREGTHLVGRTGRLYHTTDGAQAILMFDKNDSATKAPPMIVLPNLNLLSMEGVSNSRHAAMDFRISGSVTEYKGKNYILIDNVQATLAPPTAIVPAPPVALARPKAALAPTSVPTVAPLNPQTQPAAVGVMGDSATRKMNQLLAPQPDSGQQLPSVYEPVPTTNAVTGKAAVAPDAPVLKVVREGTHLINRIGRLNHTTDGNQAILTFDSDGKSMGDPPMIILPNFKLSAMEGAVVGRAGDLHFRVSGTVTEYRGRNYILLNKAVAIADVETQF